jgi:hypothetical protein
MIDPTWQDRELRILQLVVEADGRGEHLEVADIADVLSLDEDTAVRVVDSLPSRIISLRGRIHHVLRAVADVCSPRTRQRSRT